MPISGTAHILSVSDGSPDLLGAVAMTDGSVNFAVVSQMASTI